MSVAPGAAPARPGRPRGGRPGTVGAVDLRRAAVVPAPAHRPAGAVGDAAGVALLRRGVNVRARPPLRRRPTRGRCRRRPGRLRPRRPTGGGTAPTLPPSTFGELPRRRRPARRLTPQLRRARRRRCPGCQRRPDQRPAAPAVDHRQRRSARASSTGCWPCSPATGREPTVIAVPLREVDQTLHRLIDGRGAGRGRGAPRPDRPGLVVIRLGLRPLDRIGETAARSPRGDLSRRVEPADPRTEVGRLGLRAERDAPPDREGVRRAGGERRPAAPVPGRRVARAAHAAGVDPRLRRAVPDRARRRARRTPSRR